MRIPLFEKDILKDVLYQTLGFGDKDWSRRIGVSAISLLFVTANQLLQKGASVVTESNFYRQFDSKRAAEVANDVNPRIVQVHCTAPPEVLVERNASRLEPSKLRPGHHAMPSEELLGGIRAGNWEPLDIPSKVIRVDTSSPFDYPDLLQSISQDAPQLSYGG